MAAGAAVVAAAEAVAMVERAVAVIAEAVDMGVVILTHKTTATSNSAPNIHTGRDMPLRDPQFLVSGVSHETRHIRAIIVLRESGALLTIMHPTTSKIVELRETTRTDVTL